MLKHPTALLTVTSHDEWHHWARESLILPLFLTSLPSSANTKPVKKHTYLNILQMLLIITLGIAYYRCPHIFCCHVLTQAVKPDITKLLSEPTHRPLPILNIKFYWILTTLPISIFSCNNGCVQ